MAGEEESILVFIDVTVKPKFRSCQSARSGDNPWLWQNIFLSILQGFDLKFPSETRGFFAFIMADAHTGRLCVQIIRSHFGALTSVIKLESQP